MMRLSGGFGLSGPVFILALLLGGASGAQAQIDASQVAAFVRGATLNGEMVAKLQACGFQDRAEETARKFSFITLKLLESGQYAMEVQEAMKNFDIGKGNILSRYSGPPPRSVCDEALDIDQRVNGR